MLLQGLDLSEIDPSKLTYDEAIELIDLLEEAEHEHDRTKFYRLFPDEGPLRRELYAKHMEFFKAGLLYPQRCFMAANRVGKTYGGGYELTCHLTGIYPHWWPGFVFDRPISAWAAGKTNETTRDILQAKLLGKVVHSRPNKTVTGTGLIPGDLISDDVTWKQGVADLIDTVQIRHVSGAWSQLGLKSYQQGRGSFEGTEQDVIWEDEEPPEDVDEECTIRLMPTVPGRPMGRKMLTFTPLEGLSKVVLGFLPREMRPGNA